jgi:hypothetical protein
MFDPKTHRFDVWPALLPGIDAARTQRESFISVQLSGHHMQEILLDGGEYFMGICGGPDPQVGGGNADRFID